MGQKTNSNILRIGKIKTWKSKYIEKKRTEFQTVLFRDLEIKKFLSHLFTKNKLKIQNSRFYYSESSLHVYVSYYSEIDLGFIENEIKTKLKSSKSKSSLKRSTKINQLLTLIQLYRTKENRNAITQALNKNSTQYLLEKKSLRLNIIKNLKGFFNEKKNQTLHKSDKNLFLAKILKSLSLFTNGKQNIFLNLKQINNEKLIFKTVFNCRKQELKDSLIKLRKFQRTEFFRKGTNIIFNFITHQKSSSFLSEFIAFQLRKLKRPNFFLRFLKLCLKTFCNMKFSKFDRLKIQIKGRFNGASRSTHKIIKINQNVPALTLNSNIDFGESTAYTSNGTFGIKVWSYKTTL
jgi:hypothetical protein